MLIEDLKYAARLHVKAAGPTMVALLTLTIGIGASTAAISVVNSVLIQPLPYKEAQRIVIPWRLAPKDANLGYNEVPWGDIDFLHLLKLTSFDSMGAFKSQVFNLTGAEEPVKLEGLKVSAGLFSVLGVAPRLGRVFSDKEEHDGSGREAILSYQVWQGHFHGDREIIGRSIDLNGLPYTVIGVMQPGFSFPHAEEMPGSFDFPRQAQVWVPLALPVTDKASGPDELAVVARLKPTVSVAKAQAEMNLFATQMERQFPDGKGWYGSHVTSLMEQATGKVREPLLLILSAVGALLLIACANVANLLLARSLSRRSEFALRAALGAGKMRIVRQVLTESTLLSICGGAAGAVLAALALGSFKVFGPTNLPRLQEVTLDWQLLAFALAISLGSGALFGLAPAMGAVAGNLAKSLRESGRGTVGSRMSIRLRNMFVVLQIALALVLVVASGLLVQTLFRLLAVDPGFNAGRVLTFELTLPGTKYADPDHIAAFYLRALTMLRAIPGVAHAGIVETLPLAGASDATLIHIPGRSDPPGKEPYANYSIVSPDYFSAMGTPLLRGRWFGDSDAASSSSVLIVNATMAKKYWPAVNPLGKQMGLGNSSSNMTIVGVVADVKHLSLREDPGPEMFVPYTQRPFPSMQLMHVVLRAKLDAITLASAARETIRQIDRDIPLSNVTTLRTIVDDSVASQRFSALLVGAFGVLSLVLASIGLYGVISYSVSQRTREIGIRIALGAQRPTVFAMVLGHGGRLTALGILAGLFAALGVSRLMVSALYGVQATDALTFAAAVPVLAIASLLGCYGPARRAMRVEPVTALRHD
jgi:putative ABC transport system permease protein